MKNIIKLLVIILLSNTIKAQQLTITRLLPYSFPETKANFFAFDADYKILTDFSPNDFEVIEDGKKVDILSVLCANVQCSGGNYSGILTVDISGSTRGSKLSEEKKAAEIYIDMLPNNGSELAIVGFNHKNYLINDFSTDKVQLKNSYSSLISFGGTDFNAALIDPLNGALLVAERAKYRKNIILVTDGMSKGNEQEIIAKANALKAKIYVVLINGESNEFLQAITSMTGGVIFNVKNAQESISAFQKLSSISSCGSGTGCEIVWRSEPTCKENRTVTINLKTMGLKSDLEYKAYSKSRINTKVEPASFGFKRKPLGQGDTTVTFTISNPQYPIRILDIKSTGTAYSIVDYGGAAPPFVMSEGETREIKVKYKPTKDTIEFGSVIVEKEFCGDHIVSFYCYDQLVSDTLMVVSPNGKEKYLAGTDTIITWKGHPKDTVTIEYSTDAGRTWTKITRNATGLSYKWKLPDVNSDSCLIRVYVDSNPNGFVDGRQFGYGPLYCYDVTSDNKKAYSAGENGNIYVWDLENASITDTIYVSESNISSIKCINDDLFFINIGYKLYKYNLTSENLTYIGRVGSINFAKNNDGSKIVYQGNDNMLNYYEISTNKITNIMSLRGIKAIDWSKDDKYISFACNDSCLYTYDISANKIIDTLYMDAICLDLEFSPINNMIAYIDTQVKLHLYNIGKQSEIKTVNASVFGAYSGYISWSSDGENIAFSVSNGGTVCLYKIKEDKLINIYIATSSDGGIIKYLNNSDKVLWSDGGSFCSYDISTQKRINFNGHYIPYKIDWNYIKNEIMCHYFAGINGNQLYNVINNDTSYVTYINTPTFSYSPDNSKIVYIRNTNTISNANTFQTICEIMPTRKFKLSGALQFYSWHNSSNIFAFNSNEYLYICSINPVDSLKIFDFYPNYPKSCAWNYDNKVLAIALNDSTVKFYNTDTWAEIKTIKTYSSMYNVKWHPSKNLLVMSYLKDYKLQFSIYDFDNDIYPYSSNGVNVRNPQFSPDGKYLLSSSEGQMFLTELETYRSNQVVDRFTDISDFNCLEKYHWSEDSKWIIAPIRGTYTLINIIHDFLPDSSDNYFAIKQTMLTAKDVDMLTVCASSTEPKDSIITDYIINNDIFDIRVDSIIIGGNDARDFSVIPSSLPTVLKPNDRFKVKFSFSPSSVGQKNALIYIYTQFGIFIKTITGNATDCNIKLLNENSTIDDICVNTPYEKSIDVLQNMGSELVTIDSTVELGPDFEQFEILSGGGSFTIPPSGTHTINIRNSPTKVGVSTCQYAFYHKGISSPEIITIQGTARICEVQPANDVNIEIVEPCEPLLLKDTLITAFYNYHKKDILIDSLVVSPNTGEIVISDNFTYPKLFAQGQKLELNIRYTPSDTGNRCYKVYLYTKEESAPKALNICTNKLLYKWSIEPDLVKLYNVKYGETYEVTFKVVNNGNTDLYWATPPIRFNDNECVITSISPNPTVKNSESIMKVEIGGDSLNFRKVFTLMQSCETKDSLVILGLTSKIRQLTLRSDTITGNPGDIVKVPFYLTEKIEDFYDVSSGISTQISFNAKLMDNVNAEFITNKSEYKLNNHITKTLNLSLPKNIFIGEKIELSFKVGLGDSSATTIAINSDSTSINNLENVATFRTENGLLKVNICTEGGPRLINISDNKVGINKVSPNPSTGLTKIEFFVLEDGLTTLELVDENGGQAKSLYSGNTGRGNWELSFNASELSSGVYFIIMKTPSQLIRKQIRIIK